MQFSAKIMPNNRSKPLPGSWKSRICHCIDPTLGVDYHQIQNFWAMAGTQSRSGESMVGAIKYGESDVVRGIIIVVSVIESTYCFITLLLLANGKTALSLKVSTNLMELYFTTAQSLYYESLNLIIFFSYRGRFHFLHHNHLIAKCPVKPMSIGLVHV